MKKLIIILLILITTTSCVTPLLLSNFTILRAHDNLEDLYYFLGYPDQVIPHPTNDNLKIAQYKISSTTNLYSVNCIGYSCYPVYMGDTTYYCDIDVVFDYNGYIHAWDGRGNNCSTVIEDEELYNKVIEKCKVSYEECE